VRVLPAGGVPGKGGAAGGGLGPANSASENDLVNELAGPSLDEVPEELPDWSSVLVGPIYRGTEVTVKWGSPVRASRGSGSPSSAR
jgi:phospholipid/cholesterol/gamma-HCH transport system substrate-binding protein